MIKTFTQIKKYRKDTSTRTIDVYNHKTKEQKIKEVVNKLNIKIDPVNPYTKKVRMRDYFILESA